MIQAVLRILLLLAIAVVGVVVLTYPGYMEAHFDSMTSLKQSPQAARAPAFIPDSAVDISFLTNIDTQVTWGCFAWAGTAVDLRTDLVKSGAVDVQRLLPRARRMLGGVKWWPSSMSGETVRRYELRDARRRTTTLVGVSDVEKRACFHRSRLAG